MRLLLLWMAGFQSPGGLTSWRMSQERSRACGGETESREGGQGSHRCVIDGERWVRGRGGARKPRDRTRGCMGASGFGVAPVDGIVMNVLVVEISVSLCSCS